MIYANWYMKIRGKKRNSNKIWKTRSKWYKIHDKKMTARRKALFILTVAEQKKLLNIMKADCKKKIEDDEDEEAKKKLSGEAHDKS